MQRHRPHQDGVEIALANFSLTFAKALLVFCVVLFIMIAPQAGRDGTKPKAEYLITVDWSGVGKYDVDTWVKLPNGTRVNYHNKESGVVFLERDDLGNACDQTTQAGQAINACEEVTVIRGVAPGEYVLALHLYSANGSASNATVQPVNVQVRIEKLNPTVIVRWQSHVILDKVREEKGVTRFTIEPDGQVDDFDSDELPRLVYTDSQA
jgi:hypothetical protein